MAQDDFRKPIRNPSQPFDETDWEVTPPDLPFEAGTAWTVRKETLRGGKQEGVELIHVSNGLLRFTVIPTRGMGLFEVVAGDVRLGWNSPVKEVVHPQYVNLESRGGLGWLDGFNEWLVRCGLEFAGHPGEDKFIDNVGNEATMNLTLLGMIANIPASEAEVIVEKAPPHRITVRGRVDERMFYGPQLELRTEISTVPGSNEFTLRDSITNRGADKQEFEIIYHTNFGPPLLEKGSKFLAPVGQVTPMNEHAAKDIESYADYIGPTHGFIEQVYLHSPLSDEKGRTTILLQNGKADRGASMSFSTEELPYLTQWKNEAALAAGYVTGLEPGTSYPYNRRVEREAGRLATLAPGETRDFTIDIAVLSSAEEVRSVAERIRTIQGDHAIELQRSPPEIEH